MPSASAPRPKSYHMFSVSRREGLVLEQVDRPGGDVVLDRACHLVQVGGRGLRVGVGDGLQDLVACAIQVPSQSRVCSYNSPVGDGLMFPFESESTCGSKSLCTTTPDTGTLMRCILEPCELYQESTEIVGWLCRGLTPDSLIVLATETKSTTQPPLPGAAEGGPYSYSLPDDQGMAHVARVVVFAHAFFRVVVSQRLRRTVNVLLRVQGASRSTADFPNCSRAGTLRVVGGRGERVVQPYCVIDLEFV